MIEENKKNINRKTDNQDDIITEELTEEQKEWVERKMKEFYLECYVCDQCGQLHNPTSEEAYEDNEFFNTVQELLDGYAAKKSMTKEIKVNA